jgi:hypothetical protein
MLPRRRRVPCNEDGKSANRSSGNVPLPPPPPSPPPSMPDMAQFWAAVMAAMPRFSGNLKTDHLYLLQQKK